MAGKIANKMAKSLVIEAGKGTAIGLVLAFGYKVTVSDVQRDKISKYYATHKFEDK